MPNLPNLKNQSQPSDSFVSSFIEAVTTCGVKSRAYSWPMTILVVTASAIFGGLFWARMTFGNLRAKSLAEDLRRAKNDLSRVREEVYLEENEKKRIEMARKAKKQRLKAEHLERKIARQVAQKDAYAAKLKKIATWDDIVVVDKRGLDD